MLPEPEQHILDFNEAFAQQDIEAKKTENVEQTNIDNEGDFSALFALNPVDELPPEPLEWLELPPEKVLEEFSNLNADSKVDITLSDFDFDSLFSKEVEDPSSLSNAEVDFNTLFSSLENTELNNESEDLTSTVALEEFQQSVSDTGVLNSNDQVNFDLENSPIATSSADCKVADSVAAQPELQTTIQPFPEVADFADLEALLDEEATAPSEDLIEDALDLESENDEFDELEALLDTNAAEVTENTEVDIADNFADLDALLDADVHEVGATAKENEFAELDTLLEDETQNKKSEPVSEPIAKTFTSSSRKVAFEQTMRVSVKQLDGIGNLVGELVVNRNSLEQDQHRMRQFTENLLHRVQQLNELGIKMQDLYERSLLEASLLSSKSHSSSKDITEKTPERHATGMDFDALEMDRFTGFHTLSQEMIEMIVRVRESASDIEFVTDETEQVARQFRQVTTQLQEGMTRSRMIPFSQIADRLPRAVKEITLKYGKQAELKLEGGDTLIDKVILEQLYDPMTHLVNNSITHGIETLEERTAKGKSPVGTIAIRAFHQGNQTVISVADDGAGIDSDKVLTKAIQKGLITVAEARTMLPVDVYDLLFHPGFSTKDQVDEFAGRGVGMDVVRTSLQEMRGTITIDSTLDQGTTFTIRLPLTLSICKALCCLSDKARIAFPMDGVEDMMDIPTSAVLKLENGQPGIAWRDSVLPLQPLKELLNYNRVLGRGNVYGSNREDGLVSVIILRSAEAFMALQVDQLLGEQEIVIKQFEAPVSKPIGIAGATILGDGHVMPIADVLELIDLSLGRIQHRSNELWATSATPSKPVIAEPVKTEPTVLIRPLA